jgi:hypothetical protein
MSERLTATREEEIREEFKKYADLQQNDCEVLLGEITALRLERDVARAELQLSMRGNSHLRSELQSARLEGFKEGIEKAAKCADAHECNETCEWCAHSIASQIRKLTLEGK